LAEFKVPNCIHLVDQIPIALTLRGFRPRLGHLDLRHHSEFHSWLLWRGETADNAGYEPVHLASKA
jgi:hypothetical protein